MTLEARTRAALIQFIQENFDPEDIWFDVHDGCHDDCVHQYDALDYAQDQGWISPEFQQDPGFLGNLVEQNGYTLGLDQRGADAYHDDNGHTGAVQWCTNPVCNPNN